MKDDKGKSDRLFYLVLYLAIVCIAALIAFLVPVLIRARTASASNACVNALRQLNGAKQQWAVENKVTNGVPTWDDVKPYLGRGEGSLEGLHCQSDQTRPTTNTYVLGDLKTPPRCLVDPNHVLH